MKAIYPPDLASALDAEHGQKGIPAASMYSAARICLNDIQANSQHQLELLDQKVQKAKQEKEQELAAHQGKTNGIYIAEIVIGLVIAIIAFSAGSNSAALGILAIAATAGVFFWTRSQRASALAELSDSHDKTIKSRQRTRDNFQPEAKCSVGLLWWAFQLVQQPKQVALLDLAYSVEGERVSLVKEPTHNISKKPSPRGDKKDQLEEFTELMATLDRLAAESKSWEIVPAQLPFISKDIPMSQDLTREITALLSAQPVRNVAADLDILKRNGSLSPLNELFSRDIADWQKCCQNAAGWNAHFKDISDQAQKTLDRALKVFRQSSEGWLAAEASDVRPNSIWANLSSQRPDIKALENQLRTELEQIGRDLDGGIDHEQRKQLLIELRAVLKEAHDRPWGEKWMRNIDSLNQGTSQMVSKLNAVDSELKDLAGSIGSLRTQLDNSNRWLDGQIQGVRDSLHQIELGTARLRDTPFSAAGGNALDVNVIKGEINKISSNLKHVTSSLDKLSSPLTGLEQSSREVASGFAKYDRYTSLPMNDLTRLADQMKRAIAQLDEDLQLRKTVIAENEKKIVDLEDEYAWQVANVRSKAHARKTAVEELQKAVSWLTYRPESLVEELTGVNKNTIEDIGSAHAANSVQNVIRLRIQEALNHGCQPVTANCEQRMKHIDFAYRLAQQALKVVPDAGKEAEVILIPLWYVEWCEMEDSENPGARQMHYRLTTLPQPTSDASASVTPLYPAIEKYMQKVLPDDIWSGMFSPDRPSHLPEAVRKSTTLHDIQLLPLPENSTEKTRKRKGKKSKTKKGPLLGTPAQLAENVVQVLPDDQEGAPGQSVEADDELESTGEQEEDDNEDR